MKAICLAFVAAFALPARASPTPPAMPATARNDVHGTHDFDFEFGQWRVHHRIKRANGVWLEFDGTCSDRPLIDGSANIEEHRFDKPTGVTYGVALRTFDAKTGLWATWWVDARDPHAALDPPMKGRFDHGVGTFYSDGLVNGKPTRTRFVWSAITPTSARWEQAYSSDAGVTWDTNWVMEFQRTAAAPLTR